MLICFCFVCLFFIYPGADFLSLSKVLCVQDELHFFLIQNLFKLLQLLTMKFGMTISIDMLQQIWNSFFQPNWIDRNKSLDEELIQQIVYDRDRDLCFQWFNWFMEKHWMDCRDFMWNVFLTLKPKQLTKVGFW